MWSSVDLPAPDGPMIETNSPGLMSRAIRRRTKVCPAPTGNDFSTLFSDISGAVGSIWGGSVMAEEDERRKIMVVCPLSEPGGERSCPDGSTQFTRSGGLFVQSVLSALIGFTRAARRAGR